MTIIPFSTNRRNNPKIYAVTGCTDPDTCIASVVQMKKNAKRTTSNYDWKLGSIRRVKGKILLYDCRVKTGEPVIMVWKR